MEMDPEMDPRNGNGSRYLIFVKLLFSCTLLTVLIFPFKEGFILIMRTLRIDIVRMNLMRSAYIRGIRFVVLRERALPLGERSHSKGCGERRRWKGINCYHV